MILAAVRRAQESGALPAVAVPEPLVERPQRPDHGDYASSLPLRLARAAGVSPLQLAEIVAEQARTGAGAGGAVPSIKTAPPGFINIRLSPQWLSSPGGAPLQK